MTHVSQRDEPRELFDRVESVRVRDRRHEHTGIAIGEVAEPTRATIRNSAANNLVPRGDVKSTISSPMIAIGGLPIDR